MSRKKKHKKHVRRQRAAVAAKLAPQDDAAQDDAAQNDATQTLIAATHLRATDADDFDTDFDDDFEDADDDDFDDDDFEEEDDDEDDEFEDEDDTDEDGGPPQIDPETTVVINGVVNDLLIVRTTFEQLEDQHNLAAREGKPTVQFLADGAQAMRSLGNTQCSATDAYLAWHESWHKMADLKKKHLPSQNSSTGIEASMPLS